MISDEPMLPIKVVIPSDSDYVPPAGGGGNFDPLVDVTFELRTALQSQVRTVEAALSAEFDMYGELPGVAKVKLRDEALAKTKRPSELLNPDTCPVIGCNSLGELYVSVTPTGLRELARELGSNSTERGVSHISTIESIEPFRPPAPAPSDATDDRQPPKAKPAGKKLRCRLFRHQAADVNDRIDRGFLEYASRHGVTDIKELEYAEGVRIYSLEGVSDEQQRQLRRFVGLQKLDTFPGYRIVQSQTVVHGKITAARFPAPDPDRVYPVVGIIDSGTDPNNADLQRWVVERKNWVAPKDQNNDHGSFVAGLLANARVLNHNDERFPDAPCLIVDVVAFDKLGQTSEDMLLMVIDDALEQWPDVRVWNLSVGLVGSVCLDHEFSELATALDDRMKKHGVLFVIAAGNFLTEPYRAWPPQQGLADLDRISPPADSMRGLSVGSIAHRGTPATRVQSDEPSPFSRRGPGPAYSMKPELSFPGGNCDHAGEHMQTGIISIDGSGNIAEKIGTSFSTPIASAVAGHVYLELGVNGEVPNPTLVKGLMVHSAFLKNLIGDAHEVRYYGLKSTHEPSQIVQCTQTSATMIIHASVNSKSDFGKRPFPIPACLKSASGLRCEMFMTLIYDPPLDRSYGIEYCRCNVSATLGTVAYSPKANKETYTREVHPVPKQKTTGFDKDLVEHGYKWSPLKFYYRRFSRGPTSKQWRLTFDALNRAEHPGGDLDVTVFITLRAIAEDANANAVSNAQVYNEWVQGMNVLAWQTHNLQLRSRPNQQQI